MEEQSCVLSNILDAFSVSSKANENLITDKLIGSVDRNGENSHKSSWDDEKFEFLHNCDKLRNSSLSRLYIVPRANFDKTSSELESESNDWNCKKLLGGGFMLRGFEPIPAENEETSIFKFNDNTGEDMIYLYPDLKTAIVGKFDSKELTIIKGKEANTASSFHKNNDSESISKLSIYSKEQNYIYANENTQSLSIGQNNKIDLLLVEISNKVLTNAVTKYSQDNVSNHVQSSPSSTSSAGSATIKTSASNTSTTQADKNSASDVNKYTGVKKLGAVMNVRCKSTTAILYSNKYETGSKGKCIQLGDEWLTPNEFEDRAGSKAKKYLSSIKCMGRPLRVYVNSGELKGTGPPPPPKAPRKPPQSHANKTPTTIQPIAPAPPPGGVAQLTYTMAPPTPTHISNAPSLPPNLNMMMGNQGPPILINQTSMSGTNLIGSQPILTTPMTFTLAQPLEVRQNVSQAM